MKHRLHRIRQHLLAAAGQCNQCMGWFDDWPGGICGACQNLGR